LRQRENVGKKDLAVTNVLNFLINATAGLSELHIQFVKRGREMLSG
jgi:hypothetical protein